MHNTDEVKICKQNENGVCKLGSGKLLCAGQLCVAKDAW